MHSKKKIILSILIVIGMGVFYGGGDTVVQAHEARLLDVTRVWDLAPHNAFTDLIRFDDRWFLAFREGETHVSEDGVLRVLTSKDGLQWESVVLIESETEDLRDASLSVLPDGRLMLSGAGALKGSDRSRHQTYAWFSDDGTTWSAPVPIGRPNNWLWKITWHDDTGYGFGYSTIGAIPPITLFKTVDLRGIRVTQVWCGMTTYCG